MRSSVKTLTSKDENVFKFVFENKDAVVEAVLYRYPTFQDRTVICCSVMSGCPIGCRFCGTGDYFVRNLTAEEIVFQVETCLAFTKVDPSTIKKLQIMTMSMGEPMLNKNGLKGALEQLHVKYPQAALLISTSGPDVDYTWLRELSVQIPTIGLQFSVHESTDDARNKLIPFKNKLTIWQIANEGTKWFEATGRQPFFNYCAHENNTGIEDARRIYEKFNPAVWQATISVICERDESIAAANRRQRQLATDFMNRLAYYGYSTRCFDPAGQDDIGGGCGQLWFVQDWMKQHPELARPTIGRTIPIVHAPRESEIENV